MTKVIEPKARIISYGPELKIESESGKEIVITPDEFVYGASGITFKGMDSMSELIRMKTEEIDFYEKMRKSIIKSAGAGHASLATSMGFWTILEGNCSKLVDSIFTGAVFASGLMPSGRRVPISIDEILVPKGIHEAGIESENIYLKVMEQNIKTYETLQTRNVPKQEASKIVPYGHSGGGFMFIPIETLVYFYKLAEREPLAIPEEGREIISQLEKSIHEKGMGITYESRKNAPRTSCVNPNIFHFNKNLAQEQFEKNKNEIYAKPKILSLRNISSEERTRRIQEYFKHKEEMLKDVEHNWKENLGELEGIVDDFNDSVRAEIIESISWRVWGEVKRHRTLNQTAESIYNAVDRAVEWIEREEALYLPAVRLEESQVKLNSSLLKRVMSVPESVMSDENNFLMWSDAFYNSISAYNQLVKSGVKKSDAIALVPRGLKLAVIKDFDLYGMTTGYTSLRLCNTCEPEMRRTTEIERDLIFHSEIDDEVKKLISPKCFYAGFCSEDSYKTCCGKVKQISPNYNEETHKAIWILRKSQIEEKL